MLIYFIPIMIWYVLTLKSSKVCGAIFPCLTGLTAITCLTLLSDVTMRRLLYCDVNNVLRFCFHLYGRADPVTYVSKFAHALNSIKGLKG